jgi:two-component system chemotaxis response regulator CheB
MDGFTFLRILMAKQPTPVIVVSSYSQKENVFKALELGALDFVAKPDQKLAPGGVDVKDEILSKVRLIRSVRPLLFPAAVKRASSGSWGPEAKQAIDTVVAPVVYTPPKHVVAIASSTGGPSALLEIFAKSPIGTQAGFVIAQHMPDKFTRTFAERIDRRGATHVTEGQDGDLLAARTGFVCPGRQCMEVAAMRANELKIKVGPAAPTDRYVPSADRLLRSAATAAGPRTIGVILTGMGDDGVEGAKAIRERGGMVIAESAETAVVYGMPGSVVRAGLAHKVLPLSQIAELLAGLS